MSEVVNIPRGEWSLRRTRQCAKCPWRKSTDPHEIPNGYNVEKHRSLAATIADPDAGGEAILASLASGEIRMMACHENHATACVGWLHNQRGAGNNIPLRVHLMRCRNHGQIEVIGAQHESFAETIPAGPVTAPANSIDSPPEAKCCNRSVNRKTKP